jgi:uncharacterized damage-inducible protein DinB
MTLAEIHSLFQYDEWATKRTLESVSLLSEEQYKQDLKSSHGGIHGTLVHIYGADYLWLERWRGHSSSESINAEQIQSLGVLTYRWEEYRRNLNAFLASIAEIKLSAPLPYNDTKGNNHAEPLYQQMLQVINHASYHRGQIVTMLRQIGAKPQATDLIMFYRTRKS